MACRTFEKQIEEPASLYSPSSSSPYVVIIILIIIVVSVSSIVLHVIIDLINGSDNYVYGNAFDCDFDGYYY